VNAARRSRARPGGQTVNAERAWSRLVDELAMTPGVSSRRMFRSEGLSYAGKYFAMLRRDDLVVKLPATRVDALEHAEIGVRFETRPGRVMREWLVVPFAYSRRWRALTCEALEFTRRPL
jgi:hypothetical protein